MRKILGLLLLAALGVGLLPFVTTAYGPGTALIVKVTGPSRSVECEQSVALTATVVNKKTKDPVRKQNVRWSISDGSSRDRLSATQTKTNRDGQTSVDLYIGLALGNRKVTAKAVSSTGSVTIRVECVLPTPTPRPTPRPTERPQRTPRPTERPQRTEAPGVERSSLTVGYHDTDLAGRAPLLFANARGLFTEAGLETVDLVEAQDPIAGLLDGSLDIATVPVADAAAAIADGQALRMLAGYRNYRPNVIAVQPGITGPSGLAGQQVILGETDAEVQAALDALAQAGWDLEGVDVEIVTPEGGPDAWVQAFLAGDVAMTALQNRHRLPLEQADAQLVVDQQEYGYDALVAGQDLVANAPRTVQAFLAGTIGALQLLDDPANDNDLFTAAREAGIEVGNNETAGWASDLEDLRPRDGGFGSVEEGSGLGELQFFLSDRLGSVPPLADAIAVQQLNAAQAALDLPANPEVPALEDAGGAAVRVGTPDDGLFARAPFLLAGELGAVDAAGLGAIEVVAGADGIAGVLDGSLDAAVVSQDDAAAAIEAGDPIAIIAGHQDADEAGAGATVLVASEDRVASDGAVLAAFLQATLRGLAALGRADAFDTAVSASGAAVTEDVAAAWPAEVARFVPFDGSLGADAPAGGTDLSALRAAQASLGLPTDVGG
jgi:hypothetical protein